MGGGRGVGCGRLRSQRMRSLHTSKRNQSATHTCRNQTSPQNHMGVRARTNATCLTNHPENGSTCSFFSFPSYLPSTLASGLDVRPQRAVQGNAVPTDLRRHQVQGQGLDRRFRVAVREGGRLFRDAQQPGGSAEACSVRGRGELLDQVRLTARSFGDFGCFRPFSAILLRLMVCTWPTDLSGGVFWCGCSFVSRVRRVAAGILRSDFVNAWRLSITRIPSMDALCFSSTGGTQSPLGFCVYRGILPSAL